MVVSLSALRTHHTLLPRNIIIYMFPVLISVRGLVRPEGLGKFKKSPNRGTPYYYYYYYYYY
jgi:hypothetical protein